MEIAVAEINADFADVHWNIHNIVEDHDAHSDDLDIQDKASCNHDNRDDVVEKENRPIAIGPQEANIDKVVGDKKHEINFLETCEDACRSLLEVFGAVEGPHAAGKIWAPVERNCANCTGSAVVDHVESTVNKFARVLRLDELGNALQHQCGHENTEDRVDDNNAEEDREIVPVHRGNLVQEVHSKSVLFQYARLRPQPIERKSVNNCLPRRDFVRSRNI